MRLEITVSGVVAQTASADAFFRISIDGGDGNDSIVVDESNGNLKSFDRTLFTGGLGDDTLASGCERTTLIGGAGDDDLDAGPSRQGYYQPWRGALLVGGDGRYDPHARRQQPCGGRR